MSREEPRPPIIVTGAHRSGTALLARLLSSLGVFLGAHLDPNHEDFFFLRLNEWLMRRAGGAWDYPEPTLRFLDHPPFFEDTADFLAREVRSSAFSEYSGGIRYTSRTSGPLAGAWGWKDPRATFTFRLWGRVFPGARMLHVRRNGVDAAHSLFRRETARWTGHRLGDDQLRIRPLRGRLRDALRSLESFEAYLFSTRCLSLQESFRLWEEYVSEGERLFAWYDGPKLGLRYEDLVNSPEMHLAEIARFCALEPAKAEICEAAKIIDRSRAFAFLVDGELRRWYEEIRYSPHMRALGYDNVGTGL